MIRPIVTKMVPVNATEMGHRERQPSEAEVERMAKSILEDGLLAPIGVRTSGDTFSIVYGATRLLAVQKLGWPAVAATVYEGTAEDFASAEIIENLERRHLDKDELAQLTRTLVELRTKAIKNEPGKELDDSSSHNSSQERKAHPKTKVEGAKHGRPATAEGQARKEVAAKTGQSVRTVQRATSKKPKQTPEPDKPPRSVTPKDEGLSEFTALIGRLLQKTEKHKPERFAATGFPPDKIAKLARFLSDVADIKKSGSGRSTKNFVVQGNSAVSPEKSAEGRKAEYAALDAADELEGAT
jgi:ParB/RepB/Spo0J family partition protein